jgi:hypothetical protein
MALKASIITKHLEWTLPNGKRVHLNKLSQQELIAFGLKYPKLVKVEEVLEKPKKPERGISTDEQV